MVRDATPVRPESAGIPHADRDLVRVLPWNDLSALQQLLDTEGDRIAAVVMEPVNIDSGTIHPRPGYLDGVRALTSNAARCWSSTRSCAASARTLAEHRRSYGVSPT